VLNLFGLLANWEEAAAAGWVRTLLDWEDQERARRSLERRLRTARIGRFKPYATSIGAGREAATASASKR
jgi:hypothetical protein